MGDGIRIAEVMRRTGATRATIHHYVKEGLLPEPARASKNTALYDPAVVERIRLIKGLQQHYRRSLSEVREILHSADSDGGLDRLRGMVDANAALGAEALLEATSEHLDRGALAARSGFELWQLRTFEKLGFLTPSTGGTYAPEDVEVALALARLGEAGFTREQGFAPEYATIYLEKLRELLDAEVAIFLQVSTPQRGSKEDLAALAERGIAAATPLMLALRRKLIKELLG